MSRFRTIQYMIDPSVNNLVYSRVGSEIAIPVLDFEGMNPNNGYKMNYNLEKFNIFNLTYDFHNVICTRKIPLKIKNFHRKFWGMKPIKK